MFWFFKSSLAHRISGYTYTWLGCSYSEVSWGSLKLGGKHWFSQMLHMAVFKRLKTFFCTFLLCYAWKFPVCRVFAKKPLDVVHRYMHKYLCKTVSVQCVNTLNYYARKIKLHTMLWNVCSVIIVTPAGRAAEHRRRGKGARVYLCKILGDYR